MKYGIHNHINLKRNNKDKKTITRRGKRRKNTEGDEKNTGKEQKREAQKLIGGQ